MKNFILIWVSSIIFLSIDLFAQWERCDNGIPVDLEKECFTHIAVSGNNVIAVSERTPFMFISTNNGNDWEQCLNFKSTMYSFLGIAVNKKYIITNQSGVYQISSNLGQTWRKIKDTIFKYCDECPFYMENDTFYLSGEKYIYKSVDFGETWQNTYSGPNTFDLYPMKSFRKFDSNFIVSISGDGVKKFYPPAKIVEFNNGLPGLPFTVKSLLEIGNKFLIQVNSDLYISDDSLTNWNKIYHSPDYFDPGDSNWHQSFIDPVITCGNNIFIATLNPAIASTLIYSTDFGLSWSKINNGLDTLINSPLCKVPKSFAINDDYIFLTINNSISKGYIYRIKIKDCVPDLPNSVNEKRDFIVTDLSPNPTSDFIEISVGANGGSPLQSEIIILNIFGQNCDLTPALLSTSGEGVGIDVSGLAPGMYFVRIGDKVQKFIKL